MHHPSKIIRLLAEHWPTLDALVNHFGYTPFSLQDLQGLMQRHNPHWRPEKCFKEAERFVTLDIAIPLPKSSLLELNGLIFELVQHLVREHQLGLSGEIEVQLSEIQRLSERLQGSLSARDSDDSRRFVRRIDSLVRKVGQAFIANESAIYHLAEQAKTDTTLTLGHRYQLVLDAFDDYIEPMLALLDTHGHFSQALDQLAALLYQQHQQLAQAGLMSDVRSALLLLRTRILILFNEGRESLRRAADVLLPLRQELRRNTLVAKAASQMLAAVRKQGLERALAEHTPVLASDQQRRALASHSQLLAYLGDISRYQDQDVTLPDDDDRAPAAHLNLPDPEQVKAAFAKARHPSALHWLQDHYPQLAADELLHLYQLLELNSENRHGPRQRLKLADCTVELYPLETRHDD